MKKTHSLFFVLGPTGVGKSKFSLELATKNGGSILNCDSLQVYKNVPIGTNQPLKEDLKKVPHFLFHLISEGKQFSAGEYRKKALKIIEKEISKGPIFCVGGSGFYVQALEKGMFKIKKIPIEFIKNLQYEMNQKGKHLFYLEIQKKDPDYAKKLSSNDTYRILRGLAIIKFFGKKISEIQKNKTQKPLKYSSHKLGLFLEKEELRKKIKQRIKQMLKLGFIEEVERLLTKGFSNWSLLKSVGYKECVLFLKGNFSKEELEDKILIRTMQLVKKQMTWFKRDPSISWFHSLKEEKKAFNWVKNRFL